MAAAKVKIFVEGTADQKFISDYIKHLSIKFVDSDIVVCGGWKRIEEEDIIHELNKNSDQGGSNLVIFDADNDFEERKRELTEIKSRYKLNFDLFLLPDNESCGSLETLLIKIINPSNNIIFTCWENYEKCLESYVANGRKFTLPAIKTKVYAYLEAVLEDTRKGKEAIKESKRDYGNREHWDLDSEQLQRLKDFLVNILCTNRLEAP